MQKNVDNYKKKMWNSSFLNLLDINKWMNKINKRTKLILMNKINKNNTM